MLIQPTRKTGVLGVLGVPESLKASNDAAYSDGTRTVTGRNTWCAEHLMCSGNQRTPTPHLPAGPACLTARWRTKARLAAFMGAFNGAGGDR